MNKFKFFLPLKAVCKKFAKMHTICQGKFRKYVLFTDNEQLFVNYLVEQYTFS